MKSLWTQSCSLPKFEKLNKDIKTKVLIIGGGIAGILTAYQLDKKGIDYILVEQNRICNGTTQNTTAKITYQHGLIYHKIVNSSGLNAAKMYLAANKKALEEYFRLSKSIDCDFEFKDNYVYSTDNRIALEAEINALEKIGFNAQLCEQVNIPVKTKGAVKFCRQAQFNPLKFLSEIVKGLNIRENTKVNRLYNTTAQTDEAEIKADKVIITTHFPFINIHGSYFLKLYQHRSYVIALKNAADINGMYVDECKTGFSFRNYGNYLLLGGGGHRTGKRGGNFSAIREFANNYYPDSIEICSWAAQDCMSLDSVPYIGNYSMFTPNLYVAGGFNKWGMTSAMAASMILSDLATGRKNIYADVFNPSRSIIKPQLFANTVETAKNMLTPSAPRCSHLGCALKWNKAEHSWDCACHGSRFSKGGEVLNNPANKDLKL